MVIHDYTVCTNKIRLKRRQGAASQ